ncbi:glycosyltransferase [uncultured Helicobacter sp.]|uniref:glycosyltransferase n=1 Tax=uncultured Helicobacter sp. TaxID=175537 RepID=UPI002630C1E6|nr:glycosyltransferase [uncultured Helicobacter sp.]
MARKLLWVSPFSLHDTSSGAAVQCKAMLEQLAKKGIVIKALGSFIFDSPRGATYFSKLEEELKNRGTQPVVINDEESEIEYHYTVCQSRLMENFTYAESWSFFQYFSMLCNSFRPDVAMGYGVGTSGIAIHAESKRRGIPFIYPIYNGNHPYYTFDDCDLLITESQATADLYAARDRLNVQAGGIFIDKEKFVSKEREPKYITMVNPCPTKGLSIFAKLAHIAQKELPDVKFLAVDGRGSFAESIGTLHLSDSEKTPFTPKMFENVDIASHTSNMREIYKLTKVLIAPSLAYESWGRVVSEAVLNGIPVIVSANNGGGLQEAMAGMGFAINAPEECLKDHLRIPTDKEIKEWLDALKKAIKKDFSKEFKKAQVALDMETSTQRILEILEPIFAKKASQNPHIIQKGILRMEYNGSFR